MEYTKTQGHHCFWLYRNGMAIANFDREEDVDNIIAMEKALIDISNLPSVRQDEGSYLALIACNLDN